MKMGYLELKRASFLNHNSFHWACWDAPHTSYAFILVDDLNGVAFVLIDTHGAYTDACLAVDTFLLI